MTFREQALKAKANGDVMKFECDRPCPCGCVIRYIRAPFICVDCSNRRAADYKNGIRTPRKPSSEAQQIRREKEALEGRLRKETGMTSREREEYRAFCEARAKGEWCGY